MPNAEVAAVYRPADGEVGVGGDFYDVFAVTGDRVALVVGDVVGHDIDAAATMGRVRNAIRAYALQNPNPDYVLGQLNRLVHVDPELALTTAFYGVYTPPTGLLEYANAGHPHPVLITSTTRPAYVPHQHGPILGAVPDHAYRTHHLTLAREDLVLCFTDGLVERRDRDLYEGTATLCALLATPHLPRHPHHLAPWVIGSMEPQGDDDICVLALRRT
ncbi:PP2C family protein-serine/threonine phosphatase [Actinosynnema sp. NPDC020468]|uniref:PP2C family protein-serine/threonine phosphatase n=1 Tax=Actinosynnema sp. NPDC020468 TaxID=3154488 RepID=UPI0033D5D9DD